MDIANRYDLLHVGIDQKIDDFGSLKSQKKGVILWTKSKVFLLEIGEGVLIAPYEYKDLVTCTSTLTLLFSKKSPRLIFARVLNDFFQNRQTDDFKNCVEIHRQNPNIRIGENCFIGENVVIGDGTEILHNTSIFGNTVIGRDCHISTCCSISTIGLGFEYDGDELVKFPQLGGVRIGDNVEIGPSSTIRRGAIDDTIISNDCKIGSLSNIGHNCVVGQGSILTTQVAMGGSSEIGEKAFLGIGSCLNNKVKIGANVTVGAGAVVTQSFGDNLTIGGVPAKILKG